MTVDMTNTYQHDQRYQRQTAVAQLGIDGQRKLANSHVAIIGMGGLGSPVSLYLAGAGVGTLTLIDHDEVSLTNLHRQILYREHDLDQSKANCAKRTLADLNGDISIISQNVRVTADNINQLLANADIIVDASDNFALSYLLSDYCLMRCKPLISASVMGIAGYVGVFCQSSLADRPNCPSMRAVFPNPPPAGQNCNSVGVIGTSAGIMGLMQAQEVIKVIIGDSEQLAGRLLSLDVWSYRQTVIDFNDANEPDSCVHIVGKADITDHDWVIDVRRPDEITQMPKFSHQQTPVEAFGSREGGHQISSHQINSLPKGKRLVFTCASGARALMIADRALDLGFANVAVWL